jgi:hypothetical protein
LKLLIWKRFQLCSNAPLYILFNILFCLSLQLDILFYEAWSTNMIVIIVGWHRHW